MREQGCKIKKKRVLVFTLSATSFFLYCLSCSQSHWLRDEQIDLPSSRSNVTHLGLWKKCRILNGVIYNGTVYPHLEKCVQFNDNDIVKLTEVSDAFLSIRILLIITIIIICQSTMLTGLFTFASSRPLFFISAPPIGLSLITGTSAVCILAASKSYYDCIKSFAFSTSVYFQLAGCIASFVAMGIAASDTHGKVQCITEFQGSFNSLEDSIEKTDSQLEINKSTNNNYVSYT